MPLIFHDRVIGALQLLNKQDGPFTEDDVARAASIANAVAIAVSNAQLFADAASREQLLATMLEHNGNPTIITDSQERLFLLNQRSRQVFQPQKPSSAGRCARLSTFRAGRHAGEQRR